MYEIENKSSKRELTVYDLMLLVDNRNVQIYYHKDTKVFDSSPFSENELKNIDWENEVLNIEERSAVPFLRYEEIDHESIMRLYVKDCIDNKETRKKLFYILRRDNYVKPFIEELHNLDLYDDYIISIGEIYIQIFMEWKVKYGLEL